VLGYDISAVQIKHSECPNFFDECIKDYARNHVSKFRTKDQEEDFKAKF